MMDLKTCYDLLGGAYDDVLQRLRREQLVEKFIFKFLEDPSFSLLEESLAASNDAEAFRAAHTLKGVCQNLSFTKLYGSSVAVTEALRAEDHAKAVELFPAVKQDYLQTVAAVQAYKESLEK